MKTYIDEKGRECVTGYACANCEEPVYEQDEPGICPSCKRELAPYDLEECELQLAIHEREQFRLREERKMVDCDGSW